MAWLQRTLHSTAQLQTSVRQGINPSLHRQNKGKSNKAPRYGDRTANGPYGKGTSNPKKHPSSKGSSLGKGKQMQKPRVCWFCNKEGHVRADCYGYKALQATVAYTTVRDSLPDE